ncbi:lactosylceramide 4-alpha-galactosyltransferase-like [Daphnia magna]|nr:lactosylceramide 4-alpha-galactosyltransferase-like [Daphnia magna]
MRLPGAISKRKIQRRFLSALIILIVGVMALLLISSQHDEKTKPESITSLHERVGKFNGLNIFFIETSGRSCLTARQACRVESAARANPHASVTLYMEKTPIANLSSYKSDKDEVNCVVAKFLLHRIENVWILRQNLLDHLEGTPLWEFYRSGLLNKSITPLVHRSDAIRVALLWKNGGIYLDLDCIVMRPLDSLNNTVGTVRDFIPNWIENGVMAFNAGHPFLHFLMKSMVLAFRPDNYLSLGPSAVTEAILDFCDRDDLPANTLLLCSRNSSLFIQPPDSFYAIGSGRADVFYQQTTDLADWNKLKHSFLSHIYDSGSGRPVPPTSFYAQLARDYCPFTYRTSESNGSF